MRNKLAVFGLIVILIMFFSATASAHTYNYTTEQFDVDVVVEESHVFHITETIVVDFHEPKHGIYRYVPFENGVYKVENLIVKDNRYEVWKEDDNMVLQIGDANKTIRGKHTYIITYDLVCYKDDSKMADYLSLDLLPTEWETSIEASKMTVHFPKTFDEEDLHIYSGVYGDEGNAENLTASFSDDGTVMYIEAEHLQEGHGVTISADLPEGYWVNPISREWIKNLVAVLLILAPLAAFIMWLRYGRDPKLVKTVEFYPPEGMTPAEVGYVVDGLVSETELSAMVLYFAEKGYVEIHEYEDDKFEVIKKKNIAGEEKSFCKTIFDAFFSEGDTMKMNKPPKNLKEEYKIAMEQVKEYYQGEQKLYTDNSTRCMLICGLLYFVMAIVFPIWAEISHGIWGGLFYVGIGTGIMACMAFWMWVILYDRWYTSSKGTRIFNIVFSGFFLYCGVDANYDSMLAIFDSSQMAFLAVISMVVILLFGVLASSRTKQSARLKGRLLGFRNFIEVVELERLKVMVEENPSYFYKVMPYAFVFGLSDVWVDKFIYIPVSAPSWYTGYFQPNDYDTGLYTRMMDRCIARIEKNFCESSSSGSGSGGGGFSGGGFSGGGFGGGGGGSW